ncbi:MAG TPA: protein kinase [Pyrinomonadaceae bacterium]|nr:protein kinase [Pyrinomonadaceae bacterium]
MTLEPGTKLGRYEIRSKLGAGGMGEVYRARDEKLNRDVAVKILPATLSENGDRLRRFEQEAQAAGALNHPNILAIYDVGTNESAPYVVSELLEGETLRDRLDHGALPTRKAIDYGTQIARGLAAAHAKGIVHRDLKPDNLFITKDDHVKILDFGLAKLLQPSGEDVAQTDVATRKVHTDPGTVMGTAGYMAPEQVRGRIVDHRADIFSFGAVLYEMLSGRRAFHGDSAIETLNAILKEEPAELANTDPHIAPALERVVWHCLEKTPERRFQSASDIAFALESLSGVTSHPSQQTVALSKLSASRTWTRERLIWIGVCVVLLATASVLAVAYFSRSDSNVHAVRLALVTPEKATVPSNITVSPDGLHVIFIATGADGKRVLWLRSLDADKAQPLAGTEGANTPFWSADSHSIGYFANGKLFRVDASGGRPQFLCDVREHGGGTWNRDGVILFAGPEGLSRVSAQGGTPSLITKVSPNEEAHRWPYFLPDGRHFVFLGDAQTTENHHIRLGTLDTQETQILFSAVTRIAYAPPGYLLYINQGALVAHPFDSQTLKLTGDPTIVAEHIAEIGDNHEFDFSVSNNGLLAYQVGSQTSQIAWFDRGGKKLSTVADPDSYASIALSRDGKRALAGLLDADGRQSDIWLLDLSRETKSRLTFNAQSDGDPVWSPDGNHVVFTSNRAGDGHIHLYDTSANASGDDQLLLTSESDDIPTNWSRDGANLLFMRFQNKVPASIWILSLSDRQAKPLLQSPAFDQVAAAFSPDGHYIAYESNESGRFEVYVRTFPLSGRKWMISSGGGTSALWREDGKELFYLSSDGKLMSAEMKNSASFETRVTKELFLVDIKRGPGYPYAVAPDGSRFLINTATEVGNPAPMIVVLNWPATLKQK